MQQDFVLRVQQMNKRFGPVHAVADVSLDVARGAVFGFLGTNGAGKTPRPPSDSRSSSPGSSP